MEVDFEAISNDIKNKAYPVIGSGSARIVFDLKNSYVAKAAKNRRGIEQNITEYQISGMDSLDMFAKVTAHSNNFEYIIMEKAQRLKSFSVVWNYYHVKNNRQLFALNKFRDLLPKFDLLTSDLQRLSSWGLVNEKPVIIDFGYTRRVREFYRNRLLLMSYRS